MNKSINQAEIVTESDVEQKIIFPLLTNQEPEGLGYSSSEVRTKEDIRKIQIDKGASAKLYYPDYAIIIDGVPIAIIEVKKPGENLENAFREARLYASEINASYPKGINPCEKIMASDGITFYAGSWDSSSAEVTGNFSSIDILSADFIALISIFSKKHLLKRATEIREKIRSSSRYFKPVFMLGGKSVINESVGENSFGANISIEYKYLFNPESLADREEVAANAYIPSKRRLSHISPIDKIIRASIPDHVHYSTEIRDTSNPSEILDKLRNVDKLRNEICLLIGSVGSGKSTFTDYLRTKALPSDIRESTVWININLNRAILSREEIYKWIIDRTIEILKARNGYLDFDSLEVLTQLFEKEIDALNKGVGALYARDSDKYKDLLADVITENKTNRESLLRGMISLLVTSKKKSLIIVLDNCDKRNRDDQLLMFEVSSWFKDTFPCSVFLPIRDTTYDQYRNEPPLDTVIKDLVFRIDPPLLDKVIYSRLQYAIRQSEKQSGKFFYSLPNGTKVSCERDEVVKYLRSIIFSLFQDQLFKRIISGLSGRNIRKGLEIILDFCKSGHMNEEEIMRIRHSNGEYKIPQHIVSKILMKGKRKFYDENESNIKNLFSSGQDDELPDPFVRVSILKWLMENYREYGPNRSKGFHRVSDLMYTMLSCGHSEKIIKRELQMLANYGCVVSECAHDSLSMDDLVAISPSGMVHLELISNINYLSIASEDTFFRENQIAKRIANNLVGSGRFAVDSRQATIDNAKILINYMQSYYQNFSLGEAKLLTEERSNKYIDFSKIALNIETTAQNDHLYRGLQEIDDLYPTGTHVEAQVTSIQPYGVFIEFGIRGVGLIHKSNIVDGESLEGFEIGDWVIAEIIKYHPDKRRFDMRFIEFISE